MDKAEDPEEEEIKKKGSTRGSFKGLKEVNQWFSNPLGTAVSTGRGRGMAATRSLRSHCFWPHNGAGRNLPLPACVQEGCGALQTHLTPQVPI